MEATDIQKVLKNYDISATVWPIGTAFGIVMPIGPPNPTVNSV